MTARVTSTRANNATLNAISLRFEFIAEAWPTFGWYLGNDAGRDSVAMVISKNRQSHWEADLEPIGCSFRGLATPTELQGSGQLDALIRPVTFEKSTQKSELTCFRRFAPPKSPPDSGSAPGAGQRSFVVAIVVPTAPTP